MNVFLWGGGGVLVLRRVILSGKLNKYAPDKKELSKFAKVKRASMALIQCLLKALGDI